MTEDEKNWEKQRNYDQVERVASGIILACILLMVPVHWQIPTAIGILVSRGKI